MRAKIRLLAAAGIGAAALVAAGVAFVAVNCRDAPPPDVRDLEPPPLPSVPANSNGVYCLREAERDLFIPARSSRLHPAWTSGAPDPEAARELLASNALALAWIDRAVRDGAIAPAAERRPEDANLIGWSPISDCGRMLRFRAWVLLSAGRTNEALDAYASSVALARIYLACPPATDLDALAAFTEVRNALLGLRLASDRLGPDAVWRRFDEALRALSDLREARRRASAMVLAHDREQLELLQRLMTGATNTPPDWGSVFAGILPDAVTLARGSWVERMAIHLLNHLPPDYRLQRNRTLAQMAAIRRGAPPPAYARPPAAGATRRAVLWRQGIAPILRLLGPNGIGEIYVMSEAGRQTFIDGGTRLAECGARGARLVLALQRYERTQGRMPERLDELAPAWIEAVPLDPYDGRPFRYVRERRLAYAVGPNQRDDGGVHNGSGDDILFPVP